jgi:acyl dehydratase
MYSSEQPKIDCRQLEKGYEFPVASYTLVPSIVSAYLRAVEETDSIYEDGGLVPPTAVAAYTMAVQSESVSFPEGSIHVSQELEFIAPVAVGDTISCRTQVSRKQDRGKLHLLTIDLEVRNQDQILVLVGKTSFVLPD